MPIPENATGSYNVTINGIHLYLRNRIVLIKEPLQIQIYSRDIDIPLCQTSLLLLVWLEVDRFLVHVLTCRLEISLLGLTSARLSFMQLGEILTYLKPRLQYFFFATAVRRDTNDINTNSE